MFGAIWDWLNGKKTWLGGLAVTILYQAISNDIVTPDMSIYVWIKWMLDILSYFTVGSAGHKAVKANKARKDLA